MSLPSIIIKSQILSTYPMGRQLQNSVRNHCIVKTLMIGGSKEGSLVEFCNLCKCLANLGNFNVRSSRNTAMSAWSPKSPVAIKYSNIKERDVKNSLSVFTPAEISVSVRRRTSKFDYAINREIVSVFTYGSKPSMRKIITLIESTSHLSITCRIIAPNMLKPWQ